MPLHLVSVFRLFFARRYTPVDNMADSENSFFGLKVPDGTDRRELYKSQYRGIWTYKMSAGELDESFRTAVTGDGPDGGWTIKNDERVKYVGKLEVAKGEDTTLKVRVAEDAHTSTGWSKRVWGRSWGTDHKGGGGGGRWGMRLGKGARTISQGMVGLCVTP